MSLGKRNASRHFPRELHLAAVIGVLLLMGKLNLKKLLPWAMVLANTYGQHLLYDP